MICLKNHIELYFRMLRIFQTAQKIYSCALWVILIELSLFRTEFVRAWEANVFFLKNEVSYEITIDGTVTRGAPYQGQPLKDKKIYFYYPEDTILFDSALTNVNGYYTKTMNYVLVPEQGKEIIQGMKVLGNPYVNDAKINVGVFKCDKYTLRVFDLSGKCLINQDVDLIGGENLISLSGLGSAGVKIVSLANSENSYTEKIVQNNPGAYSPSISITSTPFDSKNLKSMEFLVDSVRVKCESEPGTYLNFQSKEKMVEAVNSTLDFELEQIPYMFSTTLKPFLETGAPVTDVSPGFFVTVYTNDGNTQNFSVNSNNKIPVQFPVLPLEDALEYFQISNDTSTYNVNGVDNGVLNWSIIRQPKQKTNRPNIAQNESGNHLLNVEFKTLVSEDSLDQKTAYLYTVRKKAETQQGVYEYLNSEFTRAFIESTGNIKSSMFIDLAPFGVADSSDYVRLDFNLDTGVPNTTGEQARLDNLFQLTLNTRYLTKDDTYSQDTLLPSHRVYTITSFSDPRWQEVVARGYENMVYVTYQDGTPRIQEPGRVLTRIMVN
jgi:hypothetical protein